MRIQYISDVHLEFLSKYLRKGLTKKFTPKPADILCLAGDIGYPHSLEYEKFLIESSKNWEKVFLIAGNHEYYTATTKRTMSEKRAKISTWITEHRLANVTFLDNSYEDYNGYRFVGSTLWSKIPPNPSKLINDFYQIPEMTEELYNKLHDDAVAFLESDVVTASPLPVVTMTHHLPSYSLIDPKYRTGLYAAYNHFFASECDHLIREPIKAWICGHTHTGFEKTLNGVPVYCNPAGYPSENEGADLNKFIELA
jgi:Icc-related predicted phosphoesterase